MPPRLGSSTVISGSGMAVEQSLYNSYLYGKEIQEGQHLWKKMMQEDKILQNHIYVPINKSVYAKEAICYDEKVSDASQVENTTQPLVILIFSKFTEFNGFCTEGGIDGELE